MDFEQKYQKDPRMNRVKKMKTYIPLQAQKSLDLDVLRWSSSAHLFPRQR